MPVLHFLEVCFPCFELFTVAPCTQQKVATLYGRAYFPPLAVVMLSLSLALFVYEHVGRALLSDTNTIISFCKDSPGI